MEPHLFLQQQQRMAAVASSVKPITKRVESPEPTPSFVTNNNKKLTNYENGDDYDDDDENEEEDEDEDEEEDDDDDNTNTKNGHSLNKQQQHLKQQQQSNENENGSDNEEQEDIADYCKGGYHPVKIGETTKTSY